MKNVWQKYVFGMGLLFLTGCASKVDCDVVAFHELDPPNGESVRLLQKGAGGTSGPEFAFYSGKIAEALGKIGYAVTTDVNADLTFSIDYGVRMGSTEVVETKDCSLRYHFIHRNYDDPYIYQGDCTSSEIRTRTFYVHYLDVAITSLMSLEGSDATIYEGHVFSHHHKQDLPEMMPYLIAAMFDNFPGESGVTKRVTFEQKEAAQN